MKYVKLVLRWLILYPITIIFFVVLSPFAFLGWLVPDEKENAK